MAKEELRFRRWFQLRLRSILIVFALLCIGLAWIASERRHSARQMEIVEQLRPYAFDIQSGGKYDSLERFYNNEPQGWWRDTARSLLGERVLSATCYKYTFTDATLLAELTDLQELALSGTCVSDVRPLSGLHELRDLYLTETDVADLSPLSALRKLKGLGLSVTPVTDLSPLARLERLEDLWLTDCHVNDFSPLLGLKNLGFLAIGTSKVDISDDQLQELQTALPNCDISQ